MSLSRRELLKGVRDVSVGLVLSADPGEMAGARYYELEQLPEKSRRLASSPSAFEHWSVMAQYSRMLLLPNPPDIIARTANTLNLHKSGIADVIGACVDNRLGSLSVGDNRHYLPFSGQSIKVAIDADKPPLTDSGERPAEHEGPWRIAAAMPKKIDRIAYTEPSEAGGAIEQTLRPQDISLMDVNVNGQAVVISNNGAVLQLDNIATTSATLIANHYGENQVVDAKVSPDGNKRYVIRGGLTFDRQNGWRVHKDSLELYPSDINQQSVSIPLNTGDTTQLLVTDQAVYLLRTDRTIDNWGKCTLQIFDPDTLEGKNRFEADRLEEFDISINKIFSLKDTDGKEQILLLRRTQADILDINGNPKHHVVFEPGKELLAGFDFTVTPDGILIAATPAGPISGPDDDGIEGRRSGIGYAQNIRPILTGEQPDNPPQIEGDRLADQIPGYYGQPLVPLAPMAADNDPAMVLSRVTFDNYENDPSADNGLGIWTIAQDPRGDLTIKPLRLMPDSTLPSRQTTAFTQVPTAIVATGGSPVIAGESVYPDESGFIGNLSLGPVVRIDPNNPIHLPFVGNS